MSTIKVTNIQHASASTAAIALNSDGQATLNGLNFPTAGPLSNRNLIINGAMQVAQRGTSSTTAGFGTVDRFNNGYTSGTVTQSQESLSSGSPYDEGFRNFLRLTNTTASSDNAAGYRMARYNIEAQDLASSGWNYTSSSSYLTLSFWIRASVSQVYYVYIKTHDGTAQRYVFSTGTLTADTWTKVTHQIPGNSNLTINNDNGAGLELNFSAFWGTNFTDSGVTVDTWAAYATGTRTPDMTTTWSTTASATFDITGVQLEVGEVATPFEHRSYGDELAKCQRYYQGLDTRTESSAYHAFGNAHMTGTTSAQCIVSFATEMRLRPTSIDSSASSTFFVAGVTNMTAIAIDQCSRTTGVVNFTGGSGGTSTKSERFLSNNNNTAYLFFNAEL